MRSLNLVLIFLALVGSEARLSAENVPLGLRIPPGFEVTEFADDHLASNIYSMTLDPRGRVVVSGPGYIRILVDDNGDGRADRVIDLAHAPKEGAQGMLWEGSSLYFTGDGGLRRYRNLDANGRADQPPELIRALKTGGEHCAHAVRRGPDGYFYVLCGNSTGINKSFAQLPTSPIKEPVAGCVLRFTPDLKASEIVADGFRNAYDMDFHSDGELFTFDSDNERCVSLPWYEPIRFYHVIPGGHYGWQAPQRASWWRFPPYFADVVAPVATMGRGSPTGVACYRHVQFPQHYRGGFFLLDWTFGRVYFVPLERAGASYTGRPEVFLQAVGENGFAPTALVVHPLTGDLYLSIGGRGTRGAVYRIRYPRGFQSLHPAEAARLQVKPRSLDWQPALQEKLLQDAAGGDALERLRALQSIDRHRVHFQGQQLEQVIRANWGHPDRYVRKATADLLASLPKQERKGLAGRVSTPREQTTCCQGSYRADPGDVLARAGFLVADRSIEPGIRLAGVRLMQLALGGLMGPPFKGTVWEGYSPRQASLPPRGISKDACTRAVRALREAFPTGDADLDRELSRTLAVVQDKDPSLLRRVVERLTDTSDPVEDLHYLIVTARLGGPRSAAITRRVAAALLSLDRKLAERHGNRDTNWPLRVAELHAELARKDPALNPALLSAADFGRPDHALFAQCPGFDRRRAAEIFLARAARDEDFAWNPELVRLVGSLPEGQALPVLRRLWSNAGLQEAILPLLARHPQPADREKFLEGLTSPQLATVGLCLGALEKLPPSSSPSHVLPLIRALRRLPDGPEGQSLRQRLVQYLRRATGQERLGNNKQAWTEWFARTYPDLAARLGGSDGVDVSGWDSRLRRLDWSAGDAGRGRQVFTRASCAACHSGAQAIGPDLHGVTRRFSRKDLFTAILQPSLDVSPRYRTTLVETADGRVYQGIVIYDAVGSLLLQTGPATTVRIINRQIVTRRVTETSLMPAGLLDKLSDRDIADLYAYLKSLGDGGLAASTSARAPGSSSSAADGQPVGVVCHVKVLSDKVEDVSSMEAWRRSFIKKGMTDREKALAAWETVVKFQHQDHCPPFEYLAQDMVDDPIKLFNVYGYGICSEAAANVVALARCAGLKARGWGMNNHVVSEVFWDNSWHLLDAALINYFPRADGRIAGVEEILAAVRDWYTKHPGYQGKREKLLAFMEADGGKGWRKGPELLTRCPFIDARGWLPSGEAGWYAPMLEYDGTQGGTGQPYVWEWPFTQGYQVNIQLRPGERLTRCWSNKGLHVNQGAAVPDRYKAGTGSADVVPWCLDKRVGESFLRYSPKYGDLAPGRVGNGTLEYDVPLADGAFRQGALQVENLACRSEDGQGPALHVKDPARPGTLVIRMPSSYVYLSGKLLLQAVVPAGNEVVVAFSDNNGLDWRPIARLTASGEWRFDLKPLVFRRYDYRLQFTLSGQGTGLERLCIVHDVQHSQRPLPALAQGPNTITFSAGPPEGTITVQGSFDLDHKGRQLTYQDFHPQVHGIAATPLEGWPNFHVTGKQGDVTFPVATPGDMTRLRLGCSYRAKDRADGWDLQVSFDGGKHFQTVARCAGPGSGVMKAGHSRYVTVSAIPPGTRQALVRWSGTRSNPGSSPTDVWNSTTAVYGFRIDADYREPHGGFRPVKVTFTWEENGRPKKHIHIATKAEETYCLTCTAKPLMKAITLELAADGNKGVARATSPTR